MTPREKAVFQHKMLLLYSYYLHAKILQTSFAKANLSGAGRAVVRTARRCREKIVLLVLPPTEL